MKIQEFLKQNKVRNGWFKYGPMAVYLRHGNHIVGGVMRECIDVASVEINNPKKRGKGTFTKFLTELEASTDKTIYVECVHNERLYWFLMARSEYFLCDATNSCFAMVPGSFLPDPRKYSMQLKETKL